MTQPRRRPSWAVAALALAADAPASAQEKRFDANVFRPSGAPRDLVMVQKSEVIGNLSPVVGLYTDVAFNPLVLVINDTHARRVNAVTAGLTLTPVAGIGFFNWFDVTLAVPLVAWQTGGQPPPHRHRGAGQIQRDGRHPLRAKLSRSRISTARTRSRAASAWRWSATSTCPPATPRPSPATASSPAGRSLIADYRFSFGLLSPPTGASGSGPAASSRASASATWPRSASRPRPYVAPAQGRLVIGEVYGYPSLTKFPDSTAQVPGRGAARASAGRASTGSPSPSAAASAPPAASARPPSASSAASPGSPKTSREQDEINRLQERDERRPRSRRPDRRRRPLPQRRRPAREPGLPRQRHRRRRRDRPPRRVPRAPRRPARQATAARRRTSRATRSSSSIRSTSPPTRTSSSTSPSPSLDEVAEVLLAHPEIREVRIEGHTDVRATDAYNMNLSQRRVNSVQGPHRSEGIDPRASTPRAIGHSAPVYDDTGCIGPDEQLSPICRMMTSKNRRVVFRIVRRGAPPPRPISGAPDGNGSVLPSKETVLPSYDGVLSNQGALPSPEERAPLGGPPRGRDQPGPPRCGPRPAREGRGRSLARGRP